MGRIIGAKGALGGVAGSQQGKNFRQSLGKHLGEGGGSLVHSELGALATASMQSAMTGGRLDAAQVLSDNLGSALGTGFIDSQIAGREVEQLPTTQDEQLAGQYCPIPAIEDDFSPLLEETYERFQEERANRQLYESISAKANELWNDYSESVLTYGPKILGVWGNGQPEPKVTPEHSLADGLTAAVKGATINWMKQFGSEIEEHAKIGNRLAGVVQATEGVIEMGASLAMLEASSGFAAPFGYAGIFNGIDNLVTGYTSLATGKERETQTITTLRKTHLPEPYLPLANMLLSMASIAGGGRKLMWKAPSLADGPYWRAGNELRFGKMVGYGALGAGSGAYGAWASGGSVEDMVVGAVSGASILALSRSRRFGSIFGNHYVAAGLSNIAGQVAAKIREPSKNHYSLVSLSFALYGAAVGNVISRPINVVILKVMYDSMFSGAFNGMGNSLGKQTGW